MKSKRTQTKIQIINSLRILFYALLTLRETKKVSSDTPS
jgi:hypothetical protein